MIIAKFFAVALLGYLLGSIPFGKLVSNRTINSDITTMGSCRTGATNVLRTAGKKAAFMVAVLDVAKGALAVGLARLIFHGEYAAIGDSGLLWVLTSAQVLAALTAVFGHKWSIFLKFKGGRGVATFFGGLMVLCPAAALFGGEILILGACLTRYASLGSITGAVAAYAILIPLTIINGFPLEYLAYSLAGAIFIIVMHRDNIVRLLSGTERRLGEKVDT